MTSRRKIVHRPLAQNMKYMKQKRLDEEKLTKQRLRSQKKLCGLKDNYLRCFSPSVAVRGKKKLIGSSYKKKCRVLTVTGSGGASQIIIIPILLH